MTYKLTPESHFFAFEECRIAAFDNGPTVEVIIYYDDNSYHAHHDCDLCSLITYMYLMNADPSTRISLMQVEILPF